jgi:hypothetical protein
MLRPSFDAKGTPLYLEEDLRFVQADSDLNDDQLQHLLRKEDLRRDPYFGTMALCFVIGLIAAGVTYTSVQKILATPRLNIDATVGAVLGVCFIVFMLSDIRKDYRIIRRERRIRAASPGWFDGRAVPLNNAHMRLLITTFGRDWPNLKSLLLSHGSVMSGTMNGVVELYFAAIAVLDADLAAGLIDDELYEIERRYQAKTAHSRYIDMWHDWTRANSHLLDSLMD